MTTLPPALPVAELRRPDDRFACGPLGATMTASACVRRQHVAIASEDMHPRDRPQGDFKLCRGCPEGQQIATLVGPVELPKLRARRQHRGGGRGTCSQCGREGHNRSKCPGIAVGERS